MYTFSTFTLSHIIFEDPDYGPIDRLYLQYLPSNYETQDSFPLVLDFHGFTMTADDQRQYSRWDVLAEEEGEKNTPVRIPIATDFFLTEGFISLPT